MYLLFWIAESSRSAFGIGDPSAGVICGRSWSRRGLLVCKCGDCGGWEAFHDGLVHIYRFDPDFKIISSGVIRYFIGCGKAIRVFINRDELEWEKNPGVIFKNR